jgi:hypothetical protein
MNYKQEEIDSPEELLKMLVKEIRIISTKIQDMEKQADRMIRKELY